MDGHTSIRRKSARTNREDGDVTRKRILDVAGHLFAEQGYANTTCKEICEIAKTNIAAVNYHFGGRDGLYAAVLEEVKETMMVPLRGVVDSDIPAVEKINKFIDAMVASIFAQDSWQVRLWAREVAAPTEIRKQVEAERWMARYKIMNGLISAYTGIPPCHELMMYCELAMMSPFMFLLIVGPHKGPHQKLFKRGKEATAENLKTYVLAGLDAYKAKYASMDKAEAETVAADCEEVLS